MTLDITIGNAEIVFWEFEADECSEYKLTVHSMELPDAPTFPHDNLTQNTNYRSMGYGAARSFEERTGYTFPAVGVHRITNLSLIEVQLKLAAYKEKVGDKVPGWVDNYATTEDGDRVRKSQSQIDEETENSNMSGNLARLMWMEWWMKWALENCGYPAMEVG